MSKVFYDHLVDLNNVDKRIKAIAKTPEEKEELWQLVDEMVHHKVMGCILEKLPSEHHDEFLHMFHSRPHDENLLEYLKDKIKDDVVLFIKQEVIRLGYELLNELDARVNSPKPISVSSGKSRN